MTDAFDPRAYLQDFLVEAAEHLGALDEAVLEAERGALEGLPPAREALDGLFRSMHTLKGMAGMMGFEAMQALTHALEQTFDEVRQGARRLTSEDLVVVFVGLDAIKALLAQLRLSGAEAGCDVSAVLGRVSALSRGGEPARTVSGLLGRLEPDDQMAALVEVAKGASLYELTVRPLLDCPEGFAPWHEGLGLIGRVLGVWDGARPAAAADAGEAPLSVLLLTQADRASVLDCTGLPDPAVRPAPLPWEAEAPEAAGEAAAPAAEPRPESGERASSIRVETARLDRLMELVGELVIHHTRLDRLSQQLSQALEAPGHVAPALFELAGELEAAMQRMGRVSDDLQEGTMRVRMVPVRSLFNRFPRIVRDLGHDCGKRVRLALEGADTELDKTVIEQIGDPLIHLLRNAVDHGLESAEARMAAGKPAEGTITLTAAQAGQEIVITVADDGAGIDADRVLAKAREKGLLTEGETPGEAEVLQLIFKPGFSTAAAVTHLSGRGVGLDVVQQNIQRLGGAIQVISRPGAGARFVIKLPLTLAIARALLVTAGGATFAVPLAMVEETLRLGPEAIGTMRGREVIQVRGAVLPTCRLGAIFDLPAAEAAGGHRPAVIVGDGDERLALVVDGLLGQQDVVVKTLGDYLGPIPGISGATILGDGQVALILDVPTLIARPARAAATV